MKRFFRWYCLVLLIFPSCGKLVNSSENHKEQYGNSADQESSNQAPGRQGGITSGGCKVIPIFDWSKDVFFQEYWFHGRRRYLIANFNAALVKISAGLWSVPGKSVTDVPFNEASIPPEFIGLFGEQKVLKLTLDGSGYLGHLALMFPPEWAVNEGEKITTVASLNTDPDIGGSPKFAIQHSRLKYKSSDTIELQLLVKTGVGYITFPNDTHPWDFKNRPLQQLSSMSARSETMLVRQTDHGTIIDTSKVSSTDNTHRVILTLKVPEVTFPQLVVVRAIQSVDGKLNERIPFRGAVIYHGIFVEP